MMLDIKCKRSNGLVTKQRGRVHGRPEVPSIKNGFEITARLDFSGPGSSSACVG